MSLKGSIFFYKNLKYQDGTTGEKLVVFINNGSLNKNYLALKTTSQSKYYDIRGVNGYGCFSDINVFVNGSKPFNVKTYIQFDAPSIYEFPYIDVLNESVKTDNWKKIGVLPENTLNGLIKCFKNSVDYSPRNHGELLK
jgi:hypothetical protein